MIDEAISKLATYALRAGLIEECERTWAVNTILDALKLDSYTEPGKDWEDIHLAAVLDELLDDAYALGLSRYRAWNVSITWAGRGVSRPMSSVSNKSR